MDYEYLGERKIKVRKTNGAMNRFTKDEDHLVNAISKPREIAIQEKWNEAINMIRKHFGDELTELALSKMSKSAKRGYIRYNNTPLPFKLLMEDKIEKLKQLPTRR